MRILIDGNVVQIGEQLPETISTAYIEYHPMEAQMIRIPVAQLPLIKQWLQEIKNKSSIVNINGTIIMKENNNENN